MKILLAHTWMATSEAQANVVELARELASRGHDVTVVSFGGVYSKQLDGVGIKHVEVPLSSKKPFSVARSYFILKRLIRKEKYDIVHAYSHIPVLVCGMLARKMGFCFVTTADEIFRVRPILKRVSDWGDHTFAASCDIKQYLIDSYGVPSDNVSLAVDCIDSIDKMADSHVALYEKLTPYHCYRHSDIIISGYYGYDNIGDDSLLTPITDGIRERLPEARVTVLSRKPKQVARICRVKTVNRFNVLKVWSEMRHAKLLISGGGSLLQDGTSKKSLFYYTYVMRMARKYGLKVMIYANGLGPLSAPSSRAASADVISAADYVSLRETDSLALARELGVTREMHVSADPAFLLEGASELWIDYIKRREKIDKDYFIVSVKDGNTFDGARTGRDVLSTMAEDIRKISEKYSLLPLFVPMYPSRDTDITKRLMEKVGVGRLLLGLAASELCGLMSRARFVIGTRLHTLIFAASVAVPMIGISYDPKIDAFLDYIGQRERLLDIRTLGEGEILAATDALISNEADVRAHLGTLAKELRGKALTDCDAVKTVLNQK